MMYFLNTFSRSELYVTPKKIFFHHHFKNLIVTLKLIREKQQTSIYFKGILSRASQRKHQREKKQRDKAQIKEVQQFSESGNSILYSQNK